MVINKPPGLVVHPSLGHSRDTLVNALIHRGGQLSEGAEAFRPGVVHRLDKDTSGLLLIAKNNLSHSALSACFKEKNISRTYLCLVTGKALEAENTFKSYLKRHPKDRKKYASTAPTDSSGKLAITHAKVLNSHPLGIHLLECRLETGRTHQIRVHLSENHLPIVGDKMYGSAKIHHQTPHSLRKKLKDSEIMYLHAHKLNFQHPKTQKEMSFCCSYPDNWQPLLKELNLAPKSHS